MIRCSCGFSNTQDAQFCGNCGRRIVTPSSEAPAVGSALRNRGGAFVLAVIAAVGYGYWWTLRADGEGPSRIDRFVDSMYWIDGTVTVDAGPRSGEETFILRTGSSSERLATGCYMNYFQFPDRSIFYSLVDCGFTYTAAYHWRPGSPAREIHRVNRGADGSPSPEFAIARLGNLSNQVLISEDGKEPIVFDAASGEAKALKLASPELVRQANDDSPYATWDWFRDVGFSVSEDGGELIYTRCSGDRDRPACGMFRQEIRPGAVPEALRGPAGGPIVPLSRRGQYLFGQVGYEVRSLYRLDLSTLAWRLVVQNAVSMALSPDGARLAFSDLSPNVWILTYAEGNGSFGRARRITNLPRQRYNHHVDLDWIDDAALVVRAEVDGNYSGGWRADLETGSFDLLWQGEDATQDVFFDYVRKQKAGTAYPVRIPRTTRLTFDSAVLVARVLVTLLAVGIVAIALILHRRSQSRQPPTPSATITA